MWLVHTASEAIVAFLPCSIMYLMYSVVLHYTVNTLYVGYNVLLSIFNTELIRRWQWSALAHDLGCYYYKIIHKRTAVFPESRRLRLAPCYQIPCFCKQMYFVVFSILPAYLLQQDDRNESSDHRHGSLFCVGCRFVRQSNEIVSPSQFNTSLTRC